MTEQDFHKEVAELTNGFVFSIQYITKDYEIFGARLFAPNDPTRPLLEAESKTPKTQEEVLEKLLDYIKKAKEEAK